MSESQLHVFTWESGNRLVQSYYASPAQVWLQGFDDFHADLAAAPAACAFVNNGQPQLHVFARGRNNHLYQSFYDGRSWLGWFSLSDGPLHSAPSAVQYVNQGQAQLHVFMRGADDHLYQMFYDGQWRGWFSLSDGPLNSAPCAVQYDNNGQLQLHVFMRDGQNHLQQMFYDGKQWLGWFSLSDGPLNSAPCAVQYNNNGRLQLHVFMRDNQNHLQQMFYDGKEWLGWFDLGGDLSADPTAVQFMNAGQTQLHIFARGSNGRLQQKFYDGKHWLGWFDLGGALQGGPSSAAYDQAPVGPPNVLVSSGTTGALGEPAITVSGQTVVASWNYFVPGTVQTLAGVAYSTDSGDNWIAASITPPAQQGANGDAALAYDGSSTFHFASLANTGRSDASGRALLEIMVSRSNDAQNWSTGINVSNTPNDLDDKPMIAARGQQAYVSWTDFTKGQVMVSHSSDGGQNWSAALQISNAPTETNYRWGAAPLLGAGERVFVAWADGRPKIDGDYRGSIYLGYSLDSGKTFKEKEVQRIFADAPDMDWYPQPTGSGPPPRAGYRLKLYPAFARNPVNAELYLVWQDNRFTSTQKGPYDIVLTRSADEGQSWTSPQRVNDVSGKFHYHPWLSCAANGRLDLTYYSRRMDVHDLAMDAFYQFSSDGGRTWSRALRVSARSSTPLGFMGDYIGCASDNAHAYLIWTDTRNGQNDIFFARVSPLSPVRVPMP